MWSCLPVFRGLLERLKLGCSVVKRHGSDISSKHTTLETKEHFKIFFWCVEVVNNFLLPLIPLPHN